MFCDHPKIVDIRNNRKGGDGDGGDVEREQVFYDNFFDNINFTLFSISDVECRL